MKNEEGHRMRCPLHKKENERKWLKDEDEQQMRNHSGVVVMLILTLDSSAEDLLEDNQERS